MFTLNYFIVTTVFLLLLWLLSRFLLRRSGVLPRGNRIRVRDRAVLHGDTIVSLVELEGKQYVIASNKQSVTVVDVREDIKSFEDAFTEAKEGISLGQIGSWFKKKP